MKTWYFSIFIVLCTLIVCSLAAGISLVHAAANKLPYFKIGFVTDGPMTNLPGAVSLFQDEIRQMVEGEFTVTFPSSMTLQADSTRAGVNRQLDVLLGNPDCDLIVALGMIGSTEALKRSGFNKPVIAPLVYDAVQQKAPLEGVGSGVSNLNYIDLNISIDRELTTFRKLVPFNRLTLLLDERDVEGVPVMANLGNYLSNEHSIKARIIIVGASVEEAVARIPEDTEAVVVGGLWQLSPEDIQLLSRKLIERRLPSLSLAISEYLEAGLFATTSPPQSEKQIARQAAINIQEILQGESPDKIPVTFSTRTKLSINMATARAINVFPSLEYMTGTRLIHQQRDDVERKLTLHQVVEEALKANLDLAVSERKVAAGSHAVREARSALLPQVTVRLNGRIIGDDQATFSRGSAPEKALTGSISASQLLYSEGSWVNYIVEKHSQRGREYLRDSVRLDIIFQVSTAYLDVLRKRTIERVQRENMELTQANLHRAQIRLSTGVAGPDELYRWQTQFANDRQAVLQAESDTFDAMQELNRTINRPQTEEFATVETDLKDPLLIGGDRLFYDLLHKPHHFKRFRTFALEEGLLASPELKALDAEIAAQKRLLLKAKRDYWVPTVSLEASVDELLSESGAGQRDIVAGEIDDTEWQVGVVASLPLFEGGRKGAATARNREDLNRLKTKRRNTEELISQQTLQALNNTRASYPSINLSSDAVDAARSNLQLVSDSYVLGIKSIIDLLDAQNQALETELDAANAVYNFLIDLMGVERSIGTFVTFLPSINKQEWLDRFEKFLESSR